MMLEFCVFFYVKGTVCMNSDTLRTSFSFLVHEIHDGIALMHFTALAHHISVEQNPFGNRRFTRVNVCHDTDISNF